MINQEKFAEKYVYFDRETVLEIIDIFIKEYDDRIGKISNHLKNRNLAELQKSTHAFRGVISNFETDCKAYTEISEIDNSARQMVEKLNEGLVVSEEEENKFYLKLDILFNAFKRDSRQMLTELKEIRKNYID